MPAPVTLASVRNQALQRADLVNSAFVTTAEVNQYINNSYAELWDLLAANPESEWNLQEFFFSTGQINQAFGIGTSAGATTFTGTLGGTPISPGSVQIYQGGLGPYTGQVAQDNGSGSISGTWMGGSISGTVNYSSGAISVTLPMAPPPGGPISATYVGAYSTQDTYVLPSNLYKPRGLDLQIAQAQGGTQFVTIRNFMFQERNQYNYLYNPIAIGILGGTNILYRIIGTQFLKLIPTPNIANLKFKLWYIPTYTALVNDSDTFDGINGWEEYVILDVVIKMLAKQQQDTTAWDMGKAAMLKRIEAMSPTRDVGTPQRVSDSVQGTSMGPYMIGGLPI